MLFRWVMEDVFQALLPVCAARGCGIQVGRSRLMVFACSADDTWLVATSAGELYYMIVTPEQAGRTMPGLDLRLGKCRWTRVQRRHQDMPGGHAAKGLSEIPWRLRTDRRGPHAGIL